MKLGLHIAATSWRGGPPAMRSNLKAIVPAAEEAGFECIDVADHVWQSHYMGGTSRARSRPTRRSGFWPRTRSGCGCSHSRPPSPTAPPGLLAKAVTTLDVLSGGRAMLGIGAGDYEEEAVGLGLSFGKLGDRFDLLEEALQLCLRMWDGEHGDERPIEGAHVRQAAR